MTDQWRLVNGKELYDINADPGQKKNIASANSKVVSRLTKFYDAWWEEIVPTFGKPTAIYLGADAPLANPVTLTCHDWIADGSTRRGTNGIFVMQRRSLAIPDSGR